MDVEEALEAWRVGDSPKTVSHAFKAGWQAASPQADQAYSDGYRTGLDHSGGQRVMSVRDQFAAAALPSLIENFHPEQAAEHAYGYADAMMLARQAIARSPAEAAGLYAVATMADDPEPANSNDLCEDCFSQAVDGQRYCTEHLQQQMKTEETAAGSDPNAKRACMNCPGGWRWGLPPTELTCTKCGQPTCLEDELPF